MLRSYQTKLNCNFFSAVILKKESELLKKYSPTTIRGEINFDGGTQLGTNSLTSRACHYNLLDWKESKDLIKVIKKNYITLTKNKDPIYVHSWANVMRKGEQIKEHQHGLYPYTYDHLSGHLVVMIYDDTATYYRMENQILEEKNKEGQMTLFSTPYPHWTSQYNGDKPRITIAFDIRTYWQWKTAIAAIAKFLWKKI